MSRRSNSSYKLNNTDFLFPEIYINSGDKLFCVSYFQSNPDKLDLRSPHEKLKECEDHLQSGELTPQDKFATLSQINSIQKILHGENSVEFLFSEADIGFFYNENMNPQSAIRHLEKAHSLEKTFKIDQEESINIAAETALAHLTLRKNGGDHLSKAQEVLKPYYNSKISNSLIRFKRDLSRSRILSAKKKYAESAESYEQTILSLQEVNENQHSAAEAHLYIEMAMTIELGSKSIPNAQEKSSECYMNAHKVFLEIGDRESANKIDPMKLPKEYREEIEKSLDIPLDTNRNEFICEDNKTFEETPDNIREDVIRIQKRLEKDGDKKKVKIQYLPQNNVDNDTKSEHSDENMPVPPPSEVVEETPSPSQIYLLTHDQPKISDETKVEDAKKYTETESAAQKVASFNNQILKMSRYKAEIEKNQNDNKTPEEDPFEKFRSQRRKK